jgi:hypothetical protein
LSYFDIFSLGWNLNAVMFVVNLVLAINIVKTNDVGNLHKEGEVLRELKEELDKLYPNRGLETLEVMLFLSLHFLEFFGV